MSPLIDIPFLKEIPIQDFYWGTHLFGSVNSRKQEKINKKIILVGPGIKNSIGLGHHSFLSLVESFNIIKNSTFSEQIFPSCRLWNRFNFSANTFFSLFVYSIMLLSCTCLKHFSQIEKQCSSLKDCSKSSQENVLVKGCWF